MTTRWQPKLNSLLLTAWLKLNSSQMENIIIIKVVLYLLQKVGFWLVMFIFPWVLRPQTCPFYLMFYCFCDLASYFLPMEKCILVFCVVYWKKQCWPHTFLWVQVWSSQYSFMTYQLSMVGPTSVYFPIMVNEVSGKKVSCNVQHLHRFNPPNLSPWHQGTVKLTEVEMTSHCRKHFFF